MKWNKFRLKTTTEAEDIVSSMLADLGIEGVEIEDKIPLTESDKEQMFVDILPEIEADDGVAYLSFYLEEDEDKEKVLANVKKELEEMSAYVNVGACEIEESQTEDVDWVNNWKKYFHQFYVDDILIIPSWEDVKVEMGKDIKSPHYICPDNLEAEHDRISEKIRAKKEKERTEEEMYAEAFQPYCEVCIHIFL